MRQPQQQDASSNGNGQVAAPDMSTEELDAVRSREIATKAATGTLLLLLKWLKLSRKNDISSGRRVLYTDFFLQMFSSSST